MTKIICSIIALLIFQLAIAQGSEIKVEMVASNWNVSQETTFEKFDNRETLVLNSGRVTVKNQKIINVG